MEKKFYILTEVGDSRDNRMGFLKYGRISNSNHNGDR